MLIRLRRRHARLPGALAGLFVLAWALFAGPCLAGDALEGDCCPPEAAAAAGSDEAAGDGHTCLHCASEALATATQTDDQAVPGPEQAALPARVRSAPAMPAAAPSRIQPAARPRPGPALYLRCCRFLI